MNPKNYLGEGLSFVQVKQEVPGSQVTQQDIEADTENELTQESQIPLDTKQAGVEVQPFILFGSSFPRDKEYTQVGIDKN